jgi:hypothetical protein
VGCCVRVYEGEGELHGAMVELIVWKSLTHWAHVKAVYMRLLFYFFAIFRKSLKSLYLILLHQCFLYFIIYILKDIFLI